MQYAIQVTNEPSSLVSTGRSRNGTKRISVHQDPELHRHIDQWRGVENHAEERKSIDSTSVGMPVIRRRAASKRKGPTTTHVNTPQCDPAEGRKSIDSASVGMPVIRRRAASKRKGPTTTHVNTPQCDPAEGRKSIDSASVGMPVIRRRAASKRKRSTTHVDTLQCDTAELMLERKVWTRAATRAANLECLRKNGVTKPLKKKPKLAVKPAQPLPQDAPSPVPEPAHVDDPWVLDIDAGDSDMPELCSEYVKDVYAYLMDLEVRHSVRPGYMKGYDITPHMRARLIDWLIQVHSMLPLLQETLYLTVAILDRFLQVQPVSRTKLQLVGVTAMLLASKYESNRRGAPEVQDFARLTDDAFTPAQIRRMEQVMLMALNFELGSPLPLHFLRRASKAANTTMKIHALAKYLMELTLLDYEMVHLWPSEISAASLCLSQMLLDGLPWTPTEKHYTSYDAARLKPIMLLMIKNVVVANKGRTEFQAVKSKYTRSKQMCIALLPELQRPVLERLAAPFLDTTGCLSSSPLPHNICCSRPPRSKDMFNHLL